ncbi:MAG: helix-turn-helix domain-containing protein [Opitutaceae bacterium]
MLETLRRIGAAPPEIIELFDYFDDLLLWMKDAAGHYQWVNMAFLLNFSIGSRAEILGRTDFDICGLVLANQYRIDDERVLRGERILSRVELVGRFDHTARWRVTSKIPLHDGRGAIVGTVGVSRPLDQFSSVALRDSPSSAAVRHVTQHYNESITNRELAGICGLSLRAFERHFQADYHMSPHEYVRNLRVRMSCSALVFTRKPLAEIAGESGFSDQSHFNKEFRRIMGETPRAYRLRYAAPTRAG